MKLFGILRTLEQHGYLTRALRTAAFFKDGKVRNVTGFYKEVPGSRTKKNPFGTHIPYGLYGFRFPGSDVCHYCGQYGDLYMGAMFAKQPEGERKIEKCVIPLSYLTPNNYVYDFDSRWGTYTGPVESTETVTPEDRGHCSKCLKIMDEQDSFADFDGTVQDYEAYIEEHYCQCHPREPEPERPNPWAQPYNRDGDDGIPF